MAPPPLWTAAEEGREEVVLRLLKGGANIEAANEVNWTPLHAASCYGQKEVVRVLLQYHASVEARCGLNKDYQPLHKASEAGHVDIMQLLKDHGAKIDSATTLKEYTPLYLAAHNNRTQAVQYLLQQGANVEARSKSGETPLYAAARAGHEQVVQYLIEKGGANIEVANEVNWTPLHAASYYGRKEAVRVLLRYHASVEARNAPSKDYQPLHKATQRGYVDIMQLLKDHGAKIESVTTLYEYTPLHIAAQNDRMQAVQYLLQQGANVEARSKSGETPLYVAAKAGHEQVVQYLMENGAASDIKAQTKEGWTPLHTATFNGNKGVVTLLVRNKQNLENELFLDGYRPLHKAAAMGEIEIIRILIEAGAKLDGTSNYQETPLYAAASCGQFAAVQELLRQHAKINFKTLEGWTPLHIAVSKQKNEIVSLLLRNGADQNIKNKQGKTALSLAEDRDDRELINLLSANRREIPSTFDSFGGTKAAKESKGSDSWFKQLSALWNILHRGDTKAETYKVKIAVIDSGIVEDHVRMPQIQAYEDFVTPGNVKKVDNHETKHGSTGVQLICRAMEQTCDIYVARVFDTSAGSKAVQDRIAKAIQHARTVWKVDILTLASGFNSTHEDMVNEIREASKEMLIFAAASNSGNIGPITFPANLIGQVICMFATDSNVKANTNINPAPRARGYNFAIFGVEVVPYPRDNPQSGTSMSTFIGAAVAGMILDFAHHNDVLSNTLKYLKTVAGMEAVFHEMSTKDLKYDCMTPWKIRSRIGMPREEERLVIANAIARAVDRRFE